MRTESVCFSARGSNPRLSEFNMKIHPDSHLCTSYNVITSPRRRDFSQCQLTWAKLPISNSPAITVPLILFHSAVFCSMLLLVQILQMSPIFNVSVNLHLATVVLEAAAPTADVPGVSWSAGPPRTFRLASIQLFTRHPRLNAFSFPA